MTTTQKSDNKKEKSGQKCHGRWGPGASVPVDAPRPEPPAETPPELMDLAAWTDRLDALFGYLRECKAIQDFPAAEDVEKCLAALYHLEELAHTDRSKARVLAADAKPRFMARLERIREARENLTLSDTALLAESLVIFGSDLTDESRDRLETQVNLATLEL